MPHIIHQNLLNFTGAEGLRLTNYIAALRRLRQMDRNLDIQVAGFTEVTRAASQNDGIRTMANALMPIPAGGNPHRVFIINCGGPAVAGHENVGIAMRQNLPIRSVGRTYLDRNRAVQVDEAPNTDPTSAAFATWAANYPAGALGDYRTIVYIKTTIGPGNVTIGFVHNMFTIIGNRLSFMQKVGPMMTAIKGADTIYIGGDFNSLPLDRTGRPTRYYYHSAGITTVIRRRNRLSVIGGTLLSGRLYDYWYSDIPRQTPASPTPSVKIDTLTRGLSDHCAILLEI